VSQKFPQYPIWVKNSVQSILGKKLPIGPGFPIKEVPGVQEIPFLAKSIPPLPGIL